MKKCRTTIAAIVLCWVVSANAVTIPEPVNGYWQREFEFLKAVLRLAGKDITGTHPAAIGAADSRPADVVLRRTRALIELLREMPNVPLLDTYEQRQQALERQVASHSEQGQLERFMEICRLRREIALLNPLLDFDEIVFISHMPKTFLFQGEHIAWEAVNNPKYGLYLVSGLKSGQWKVNDLLDRAVVQNGRLKGKNLSNKNSQWAGRATVHSPGLDYDGRSIVFSWALSTAKPDAPFRPRPPYNRTANTTFDIFTINMDGSDLRQLTNEDYWDNYDGCFMPDGRILFVSDRRNAQERCGTKRSAGTLFSMEADGSDVVQLSWHETNERYPSIDNDGMIVYSRWDYIDRDFYAAHDFWRCFPDGRDPRSPHGNYNKCKPFDPMAECAIRAIPGTSGKYMAVETGHHLAHRGNVIVLNMKEKEESGRRIRMLWPTWKKHPDGHPLQISSETSEQILEAKAWNPQERPNWRWFTEPYPLSEDFVIVSEFRKILLLDSVGNEIVLFDAEPVTGSITPVRWASPVMPRRLPNNVPPTETWQGRRRSSRDMKKAVVSVMNVYESDFEWPANTQIKSLRIIQIIPKPKHPWNEFMDTPVIGYSNGGLVRQILGTVPVEEDGSAYFYAPIEREILFQALDGRGRAVQSMRSGTYVHPGEHLTCMGCHEDKHKAPAPPKKLPLAMQRIPSDIRPEPTGSLPFNFYQLVKKPVFDKKCTPCHQERGKGISFDYWKGLPLRENKGGPVGELEKYVTYYHASDLKKSWSGVNYIREKYVSKPGEFGALGSPLLEYLDSSHYGVDLTGEEYRRVVLWLDANCQELGCYDPRHEALTAQRQGISRWPAVDVDPNNPTGVQLDGADR